MNNKLGKTGEQLAAKHLKALGHKILQLNYRAKGKEIDIISLSQGILVFTEVKTRTTSTFGNPETAVSSNKQQRISFAAQNYLQEHAETSDHRFDVISIILNGNQHRIRHFKEAFVPGIL